MIMMLLRRVVPAEKKKPSLFRYSSWYVLLKPGFAIMVACMVLRRSVLEALLCRRALVGVADSVCP